MNKGKEPPKHRRRSKSTAWHWQQTETWYHTPPGSKQRVPLFDDRGQRIRGQDQKQAAELALARLKARMPSLSIAKPPERGSWDSF
jgi:hypothetical protein